MDTSDFIKIDYLHFLCKKDKFRMALYFAYLINIPKNKYPKKLLKFEEENFGEAENTQKEVDEFVFFNSL